MQRAEKVWAGVGIAVVTGAMLAGLATFGAFQLDHYAVAEDDHNLIKTAVETQAQIAVAVEKLTSRQVDNDAKRSQTIEFCNTSVITSCRVCRNVGIEIEECED